MSHISNYTCYIAPCSLLKSGLEQLLKAKEEKIPCEYTPAATREGEEFDSLAPNPIHLCAFLFWDSEKCMKH